jgi:hypothetical protein
VRVCNNFGVRSDDLQVAQGQAEAVLRDAGIDVLWMNCGFRDYVPADAPAACRQAPEGNDLILRLQRGTPTAGSRVSMGFSWVNEGALPAFLSTVLVDVVWSMSRGTSFEPRALLGFAIAHELGHLLLNTKRHAETGLMRAVWSRAELSRTVVADWRFLDGEVATMREAIVTRASACGTE